MLAELFPVPIDVEGVATGGVSLAAVFIVGTAVLYGWAPAVIVAFLALRSSRFGSGGGSTAAYNGAVYAISAAAAGAAAAARPGLARPDGASSPSSSSCAPARPRSTS